MLCLKKNPTKTKQTKPKKTKKPNQNKNNEAEKQGKTAALKNQSTGFK